MREAMRQDGLAAMSPATASTGPEQRVSPRFTLLMRAAKLVGEHGEYMCIVRDASDSGVNIRLFHPLPDADTLMLEFPNGDRHPLELVWQDSERAGLRFAETADIARLLECPSQFARRPIRVNLDLAADLLTGSTASPARLLDLSQQGAKLICDFRHALDQRVRLSARGLPEVNAKIRWRRDNAYGLVFEDTFQFGDLAQIVAALQAGPKPQDGTPAPRR
ncbi:MAG: PilZ domain-containing protein [Alteraurantiacibacter sp.]